MFLHFRERHALADIGAQDFVEEVLDEVAEVGSALVSLPEQVVLVVVQLEEEEKQKRKNDGGGAVTKEDTGIQISHRDRPTDMTRGIALCLSLAAAPTLPCSFAYLIEPPVV